MTKGFRLRYLIAVFFLAPSANANWVFEKEEKFTAETESDIRALVARFPGDFFERAEDLEFASAHVLNYAWKGATLCAPGDSRLHYETVDTESRRKPAKDGKSLQGAVSSISGIPSGDPCAPVPLPEGQWVLESESNQEYRTERELTVYLEKPRNPVVVAKADELEFASENIKRYRWVGKTSCALGDPRLTREQDEGEVRFKPEYGLAPLTSASYAFSDQDPCRN